MNVSQCLPCYSSRNVRSQQLASSALARVQHCRRLHAAARRRSVDVLTDGDHKIRDGECAESFSAQGLAHPSILRVAAPAAVVGAVPGLFPDVSGPASFATAIAILCGIVAFHELGHFTAARLQGIHVSRFAIGFGPKLLSFKPGNIEYSLRALPLGGYVAFPDNDPDCPYPDDDPDLLKNRPILDRFWVISAGVVFNVLLAFLITLAQVHEVGYPVATYKPGVRVPLVMQNSAAQRYGLLAGDMLLAVDGKPLSSGSAAVKDFVQYIKSHRDVSIDITVARGLGRDFNGAAVAPEIKEVYVLPDIGADGAGKIGVQLQANADVRVIHADGPVMLVKQAAEETWRLLRNTFDGFVGIVTNFGRAQESVSGPIAVVAVGAEVARSSPTGLYPFAAAVNVNLAVVNALPLPALDGGYLLLLFVEVLRKGRRLPQGLEALFNASGLLLLVGAGVFLILRDTFKMLL